MIAHDVLLHSDVDKKKEMSIVFLFIYCKYVAHCDFNSFGRGGFSYIRHLLHTYIVEQIKTAILIYMGTFSTEPVDRNFINFPLIHIHATFLPQILRMDQYGSRAMMNSPVSNFFSSYYSTSDPRIA